MYPKTYSMSKCGLSYSRCCNGYSIRQCACTRAYNRHAASGNNETTRVRADLAEADRQAGECKSARAEAGHFSFVMNTFGTGTASTAAAAAAAQHTQRQRLSEVQTQRHRISKINISTKHKRNNYIEGTWGPADHGPKRWRQASTPQP